MNRYFFLLLLTALYASCQPDPSAQKNDTATEIRLDSITGEPIYPPNPWSNAGCTLVTDEEVEKLFGIDGRAATLNTRSLPDQSFCLRTWNKPDWKERETNNDKGHAPYLDPQNRLIIEVIDYHTPTVAREQFKLVRESRRNGLEETVAGLGEDALWSNSISTLVILKERFFLKISLEHVDEPHGNLEKAKEVAAAALEKM